MQLELPPLPYPIDALEPYVSRRTLEFHHGKHHKAYVDKTKALTAGTDLEGKSVEEIIAAARERGDQTLLNQSGQVWNHTFFWQCMSPPNAEGAGGAPPADVQTFIETGFASLEAFKEAFKKEAVGHFASGWAWLCDEGGKAVVISLHDGEAPVGGRPGLIPLLTCDVWEHAYYLDYQNDRGGFVQAFLDNLINWKFVQQNLAARSR